MRYHAWAESAQWYPPLISHDLLINYAEYAGGSGSTPLSTPVSTPCRMLADQGAVPFSFEADSESQNDALQPRMSFASSTSPALLETTGVGRHLFFKTRKLQRVAEAF